MSELKITGVITLIKDKQSGTTKTGDAWEKIEFVVTAHDGQYENKYCFEVFGVDKVEKFEKFNKLDQVVDVRFNIRTNEWLDPKTKVLKHFTSLAAWSVFQAEGTDSPAPAPAATFAPAAGGDVEDQDDLPF